MARKNCSSQWSLVDVQCPIHRLSHRGSCATQSNHLRTSQSCTTRVQNSTSVSRGKTTKHSTKITRKQQCLCMPYQYLLSTRVLRTRLPGYTCTQYSVACYWSTKRKPHPISATYCNTCIAIWEYEYTCTIRTRVVPVQVYVHVYYRR